MDASDACPVCGTTSAVRTKLVLIDEAWNPTLDRAPRERYFADVRVDDIRDGVLRERPLEQFIDGFYCDRCKKAFVSEDILQGNRWRYRSNCYGSKPAQPVD